LKGTVSMIYSQLFDHLAKGKSVKAGLIGAGHFATAIVTQSTAISRLDLPIVADINVELARKAFLLAGYSEERIAVCSNRGEALQALERGKRVVLPDGMLMMDLPIDVVVECTGAPEAAARHCEEAIRQGKHVANVTKEMDIVVGPIIKHMADRAGLVYSTVDGDQPGLLIGLVEWARELGLEVIAGGKSIDCELAYDPATQVLTYGRNKISVDAADAKVLEPMTPGQAKQVVAMRSALLRGATVVDGSDSAELAMVANATGLMPDVGGLHCAPLRTPEIPEVYCPVEEGGILQRRGVIDAVLTLHDPHEAGMGGGVYIVVGCENEYSRRIITSKGLIANSRRSAMLIYRPHHLCGVEAPMTVLCAALLGVPTGGSQLKPRVDVVARAALDLAAGEPAGYEISGEVLRLHASMERLDASMVAAASVEAGQPLPIYLASQATLKVDVSAGNFITPEMVVPPVNSRLWALRAEQDRLFFGHPQTESGRNEADTTKMPVPN
jgi:predicted homoserine dehydrogenase-like protein